MPVRAPLHYALEVPDPAVGERFYEVFGLTGTGGSRDSAVHLRPAPLAREAVLLYGGEGTADLARTPRQERNRLVIEG
ncbi:MAG: hypothetical protein ACREK9_17840 [Candidatus Rokuibacteriota bacterium]